MLHDIFWQFVENVEFVFRINHNIKKSDDESLKNLFLFHGLLYYFSEKKNKNLEGQI